MSREEYLLDIWDRDIDRHLCHAKAELSKDEYEELIRRIVRKHEAIKHAALNAAFVEAGS